MNSIKRTPIPIDKEFMDYAWDINKKVDFVNKMNAMVQRRIDEMPHRDDIVWYTGNGDQHGF